MTAHTLVPQAAAQAAAVSWDAAPNCTGNPSDNNTKVVYDSLGRPWGFENGQSCAFRWALFVFVRLHEWNSTSAQVR